MLVNVYVRSSLPWKTCTLLPLVIRLEEFRIPTPDLKFLSVHIKGTALLVITRRSYHEQEYSQAVLCSRLLWILTSLAEMDKFEKKMKDAGLSQAAIAAFRMNYDQLAGGATGLVGHAI